MTIAIRQQPSGNSKKLKLVPYALCAMLFALCGCSRGAAGRESLPHRFLDDSTASDIAVLLDMFRQELSKLGWIEGKNITIEYRFAEENMSACLSLCRTWFVLRWI